MNQDTFDRWQDRGRFMLMVIGAIAVLRFIFTIIQPTYSVRLTLEDLSADAVREPIAYLEERWFFSENQYPLRFRLEDGLNDWQYEKDGEWRSLNMTKIGQQVDVNNVADDSDQYRDGF
jgi:hypothetical protein